MGAPEEPAERTLAEAILPGLATNHAPNLHSVGVAEVKIRHQLEQHLSDQRAVENEAQEAVKAPAPPTTLEEYAGAYGPRKIFFKNGSLQYMRDGMPMPATLKSIGVDSFAVDIPPGAQVRGPGGSGVIPLFVFARGASGAVESLSLVNPDGTVVGTAKREN